jgi:hypothetical protein
VARALSRRELLERATALAGGALLLAGLPDALCIRGWLEAAEAAGPSVVEETMNGLVAFVVPGRDRYSIAQGAKSAQPGGIEAGATPALIATLDRFLPSNPPLSSTTATILNQFALTVRASSRRGKFSSAFANLSVAEKAKVFQALEALTSPDAGSIRFLFGNLPDLAAFLAYSEAGVFDRRRRRLRRRPLGWSLTRYGGTADGHAEFRGYLGGRRAAEASLATPPSGRAGFPRVRLNRPVDTLGVVRNGFKEPHA